MSVVYDKGVKIDRDSHGNIYLTKLSDCEVIVKGFQHPESHCIANAVVETSGRVGSKKTKVVFYILSTSFSGCSGVVEYRTRNREVAGSTHTRSSASNLEQVANLLYARANSTSNPQRDGK